MNFSVDGKKCFDIPLPNVEQAHIDKQEVVINFPQDNAASIEGVIIYYFITFRKLILTNYYIYRQKHYSE